LLSNYTDKGPNALNNMPWDYWYNRSTEMWNIVDITYMPEIINALPVLSKALNMQETFAGHSLYYRARIQLIF